MSAALVVVEPDDVECPTCCGQGILFERQFGRHVADEYLESECPTCHGTGTVPEDLARTCESCGTAYLAELGGCRHFDLCADCGPVCKECAREIDEDTAYDQYRALERLRMAVTS